MKTMKTIQLLVLIMLCSIVTFSQTASVAKPENKKIMETKTMKTYVIEREIPGAGTLDAAQLKTISQTSCSVLKELGPDIEWVESYVTDNKIFCVYRATNEEILKTHAQKGGFPINAVHLLSTKISPATATN
jgi:hypothetical protein